MSKELTKAQKRLIESLRAGQRLWRFGDSGFGVEGLPEERLYQPRERTINILLEKDLLRWKSYKNDTQRACGIRELELT